MLSLLNTCLTQPPCHHHNKVLTEYKGKNILYVLVNYLMFNYLTTLHYFIILIYNSTATNIVDDPFHPPKKLHTIGQKVPEDPWHHHHMVLQWLYSWSSQQLTHHRLFTYVAPAASSVPALYSAATGHFYYYDSFTVVSLINYCYYSQ